MRKNSGPRNMTYVVWKCLYDLAKRRVLSYRSAHDISKRFEIFMAWAKSQGVRNFDQIIPQLVSAWGRTLAKSVRNGELKPSYAQNLVSSVNTAMKHVTQNAWESVCPVRDCGIPRRSNIRTKVPGSLDRNQNYKQALEEITSCMGVRMAVIVMLCRELGLRVKEASLIDAKAAYQNALETGWVTIVRGTKGGRERKVPITTQQQTDALSLACGVQGNNRSMIPADTSFKTWYNSTLSRCRAILRKHTGAAFHDLRAAYACERYTAMTKCPPPVVADRSLADRATDRETRMILALELGHRRLNVTSSYIGRMTR